MDSMMTKNYTTKDNLSKDERQMANWERYKGLKCFLNKEALKSRK
jgi:hypothetical protein